MDEILSFTLKEIGGAAAILAAFSAFLGAIWKNRIHMREKYQFDAALKQIESSHARQTQTLEHELQIERHAAQLGHAKLIEKRASIIDDVYKLLVELHEAIYDTIRPDYFGRDKPSKQEAYELALPKFDSFVESFEKNKIYFSTDIAKRVSEFYVAAAQTLDQSRVAISSGESLGRSDTPNLQKLFEKVNYEMGQARKAVEEDFRGILRVGEV
ncbi:hypothetical protein H5079_04185 [Pseudoalteromonas sp. SG44-5]|uniref:hypothetical protein n=1 Tax=Pseudoalteromonas sp. SG44-5 TaxID=2760960 RepID=UPI0015FBF3E6|nr:hypothetical protein [Pseudoalteromonas sp. SG44-5]MBB1404809.1 hypothetical protein [Pseudoalteromonas sp. SG44-5]